MAVLINGTNGLIQAYDYQTPSTGFSYTFAAGTQTLVMNPAGTLATGTITMPPNPSDGMTITFSSTQQITALTLSGNTGQTVVSGTSSMPAGSSATYIYRATNTSWYPLQAVPTANTQLGIGQTWTDVKASRAIGTTYTNSTSKPIFVAIQFSTASSVTGTLTIAGVAALNNSANAYYNALFGIVPSGATYVLSGVPTISAWTELR